MGVGVGVLNRGEGIRTVTCHSLTKIKYLLFEISFFSKCYVGILKGGGGGVKATFSIPVPSLKKQIKHYLKLQFFQIFCVITTQGMSMCCKKYYAMFILSLMT